MHAVGWPSGAGTHGGPDGREGRASGAARSLAPPALTPSPAEAALGRSTRLDPASLGARAALLRCGGRLRCTQRFCAPALHEVAWCSSSALSTNRIPLLPKAARLMTNWQSGEALHHSGAGGPRKRL